ncbi:NAD(P)H-hydrate epimerase [Oribacterium sp. HCP3S3_B9]|uniref:NAD(P)H-hydrate epimerase n=1 Tax=Oribacterium sp. HCP3S3_B9 TaxID=3438946 RepID=UPI003F8CBB7A
MQKSNHNIKTSCITGTVAKAADRYAMDVMGLKSLTLMETASSKVAEYVMKHYPLCGEHDLQSAAPIMVNEGGANGGAYPKRSESDGDHLKISVLCGVGNNGADGVCASRMLLGEGYQPQVYIVGNLEKASWEFLYQLCHFQQAGGTVTMYHPDVDTAADDASLFRANRLPDDDIQIDGIFGIGLHREIAGDYRTFIEEANRRRHGFVLAIDAPSGINTDTGELMGCGIKADVTITFGRNKTGLVCGAGQNFAGRVLVEDIGIPDEAYEEAERHA